ncbi:hypothetical protein HK101_006985, partial [Irineochytrium annulatum]
SPNPALLPPAPTPWAGGPAPPVLVTLRVDGKWVTVPSRGAAAAAAVVEMGVEAGLEAVRAALREAMEGRMGSFKALEEKVAEDRAVEVDSDEVVEKEEVEVALDVADERVVEEEVARKVLDVGALVDGDVLGQSVESLNTEESMSLSDSMVDSWTAEDPLSPSDPTPTPEAPAHAVKPIVALVLQHEAEEQILEPFKEEPVSPKEADGGPEPEPAVVSPAVSPPALESTKLEAAAPAVESLKVSALTSSRLREELPPLKLRGKADQGSVRRSVRALL